MKKLLTLVLALLLATTMTIALVACTPEVGPDGPNDDGTPIDTVISNAALADMLGDGALFLTTVGRADFPTAKTLLTQVGFATNGTNTDPALVASDESIVAGSTVVIMTGTTGKGLGDAGTSIAIETQRAEAFAARADINIIVLHVGKAARRGASSDPIIEIVAAVAKAVLVVDDGTAEGGNALINNENFDTWCQEGTLYRYSKAANMLGSLKFLLGK